MKRTTKILKTKIMKDYKKYKKKHEAASKGLGDTISKITKATGIEKAVKFIAGEDCGCDKRQELLNKRFRYDIPTCLNEEEYNYLSDHLPNIGGKVDAETQRKLLKIHNRIFKHKKEFSSCGSCVAGMVAELKAILDTYGN